MAVTIVAPQFSFLQFSPEAHATCSGPEVDYHLPVLNPEDLAFQFFVNTTTKAEADALFDNTDRVGLALVKEPGGAALVNYLALELKPARRRTGEKQVMYQWPHGVPLFSTYVAVGGCFHIRVTVTHPTAGTITAYSTTLQRIAEDCYTAVLTYDADQNVFGFNYCGSGATETGTPAVPEGTGTDCEATIYQFNNVATIDYYYSPALRAKYGDVPRVDIWIVDEATGQLVKPVIRQGFNTYPPTRIIADLGGMASGILKIS